MNVEPDLNCGSVTDPNNFQTLEGTSMLQATEAWFDKFSGTELEILQGAPAENFWESLAMTDTEAVLREVEKDCCTQSVQDDAPSMDVFPLVKDAPMPIEENGKDPLEEEDHFAVGQSVFQGNDGTSGGWDSFDIFDGNYNPTMQVHDDDLQLAAAASPFGTDLEDFVFYLDEPAALPYAEDLLTPCGTVGPCEEELSFDSGLGEEHADTKPCPPDQRDLFDTLTQDSENCRLSK